MHRHCGKISTNYSKPSEPLVSPPQPPPVLLLPIRPRIVKSVTKHQAPSDGVNPKPEFLHTALYTSLACEHPLQPPRVSESIQMPSAGFRAKVPYEPQQFPRTPTLKCSGVVVETNAYLKPICYTLSKSHINPIYTVFNPFPNLPNSPAHTPSGKTDASQQQVSDAAGQWMKKVISSVRLG